MAARRLTLDVLRIAEPCTVSWRSMAGDGRKRFCEKCHKHVYNSEAWSRAELNALLAHQPGEHGPCMRLCTDRDGSVLTRDTPRLRRAGALIRRWIAYAAAVILAHPLAGCTPVGVVVDDNPRLHERPEAKALLGSVSLESQDPEGTFVKEGQ